MAPSGRPWHPQAAVSSWLLVVSARQVVQPNLDDVFEEQRQVPANAERRFGAIGRADGQLDDARTEFAGQEEHLDVEGERTHPGAGADRAPKIAPKPFEAALCVANGGHNHQTPSYLHQTAGEQSDWSLGASVCR